MNPKLSTVSPSSRSFLKDAIFKAIFTKNIPESKTALKSLLSAFLEKQVSGIDVRPNEPPINDFRDRQIRFDILVDFNNGEKANVEMTLNPTSYESLRFEYYTARIYVGQDIQGQLRNFCDLKPTYHLSFLYRDLYDDKEWLHRFVYYDPQRDTIMGGRTEIVAVELEKLKKVDEDALDQLSIQEAWAIFMTYYNDAEKAGVIDKLIEKDEGIAAADKVYRGFTENELANLEQIRKDIRELDYNTDLLEMKRIAREEGLAEGHAEGHAQGLMQGKVEVREAMMNTARKMKSRGLPIPEIAEDTGLSLEDIERL